MTPWLVVPLLLLGADKNTGSWQEAAPEGGVTVLLREHRDTGVHEFKATGVIDADPESVWKVIRDYAHYQEFMPYMREARVVKSEQGGKVLYVYSLIAVPFLAPRDYVVKITDESTWHQGQGYFRAVWTISPKGPAPKRGTVRLAVNDGYWHLVPLEGGTKTFATYYLYTDPGGAIPKWIVNRANSSMVSDLFRVIRHRLGVDLPPEPGQPFSP